MHLTHLKEPKNPSTESLVRNILYSRIDSKVSIASEIKAKTYPCSDITGFTNVHTY